MVLALLVTLAAAPPAWSVKYSTSVGTDHGNGVIAETQDSQITVTPTEARRVLTRKLKKGKPTTREQKPLPVDGDTAEALAAAVAKLPMENTTYSTSPSVDDEGWNNQTLQVMRAGKTVSFQLVQGKQAPAVPQELTEVIRLVVQAATPQKRP
ncbi:MAG: hypothetical protein IPJ65_12495 [Archangiaceae bacterium]|nr:hypothetical protein [Archangiaceae bacterium]